MNKDIIFWIIILLICAIGLSLLFPPQKEVEVVVVVEPEPVEVVVNSPTAKDLLIKIRENQTKEEEILAENVTELKNIKRNELLQWDYIYTKNSTNADCYAICKTGVCEIIYEFCTINETLELQELIK